MKKIFFLVFVLVLNTVLMSQENKWKYKGMLGATYNETQVSSNWTGPEINNRNWGIKLDASAEQDGPKINWITVLKEEYGRTSIGDSPEQISADLIDLSSVYFWKWSIYVNPYISFIMTTQNTEIFQPVTLNEAAGIGFIVIKEEKQNLKTRAGIAFRQTYDKEHIIPNTVFKTSVVDDPNTSAIETSLTEVGTEWITNYDLLLMDNIKFISEARVFSTLSDGASLRWDNGLLSKLGKYLTAQIGYLVIYNYDRKPKPVWSKDIETRLTFTLGLSYNLF